jgi:hypothetical protein
MQKRYKNARRLTRPRPGFKSSSKIQNLSGWWLSHPSEKYDIVSWDKIISNIWKFIKIMFQTTNQL